MQEIFILQGCHSVREKQKFSKVSEKSANFANSQGKSQFLSKSVKSQGIFWNSGWKVREFFGIQGNHGIFREFTGFWTQGIWNDLRSKSGEKRKEIEHEDKNIDGLQKKLKLM